MPRRRFEDVVVMRDGDDGRVYNTCEGGERKPARVFSVKPARKMISNIDYPIISHLIKYAYLLLSENAADSGC